jgi:ferredoxin
MEMLFTPDDAALAALMPVQPTAPERLCGRTGLDARTLRARLDAMADRGLVLDLRDGRTGAVTYMLAPPVIGFFEFSMMRLDDGLPKARLARAYDAYVHRDTSFFQELSLGTAVGRALVHETALADDLVPEVLDWEQVTALVEQAGTVGLTNCMCRHGAQHLGTACDAPLETCMSLGTAAELLIRHGLARQIGTGEGLDVLNAARERGLVHIGDNVQQNVSYVCSCCSCCCHELRSVQAGLPMVQASGFEPVVDRDACTACGRCVRACPVQAMSLVSRGPAAGGPGGDGSRRRLVGAMDPARCLGCAVCVGSCRDGALAMRRRPAPPHVPLNAVEFVTRRMIERGRLADLLIDGAAGRGPRFVQGVLAAVLALPPAERVLAREQVRSRFVDFVLARR